MNKINNGDIFDIGQTVNGVSRFLWLNNKWYYVAEGTTREYEYDQDDLTQLIIDNDFDAVSFIANIIKL